MKWLTIDDFEKAIEDYEESIQAAERFEYDSPYLAYLSDKGQNRGLCYYFQCLAGKTRVNQAWVQKYIRKRQGPYLDAIPSELCGVDDMRWALEIRLEVLKKEYQNLLNKENHETI